MAFFDYFRKAPKSAALAKDRLSIIVARERTGTRIGGASYLPQLQQELLAVIARYETIDIGNVTGDDVRLQLPVWSPGRYARFDFARNVQELTIHEPGGAPMQWQRENGSLWHIHTGGARTIAVHYRVFANTLSGTFSALDTAHANWNGASLFMYVVDHKPDPVSLHVDLPPGWHIVNGDARTPDQIDYRFENYDRLIDTPTEVAPRLMVDSFTVEHASTTGEIPFGSVPPVVTFRPVLVGARP